jgi:tetratricopeptide (TPR) repeat protein
VLDRLTEQESANRQTSRPIERFAWPLSLGIFLLMLAWIISALPRPAARPVVLALAVAAFTPAPSAQAAGAGGMLAALFATSGPTPDDALKALKAGDFKKARDLYGTLLEREDFDALSREELLYGLATTEHDLTNYDGSVKNFSEVLHTQDKSLRARAHRGLGQTLYDQGVRGLQQQPKITLQRWTDALRHLEAAQDLDPENKELRENREHVDKMLAQLRQVMKQMEEKQGKKGDKGKKGQKGDKGQGQQGEEGDEGDAGKEGSDPNGEGEPKEPKEGKGEKKESDDGIGGKDAKELPEGRLQAAGSDPAEKEGQKGKEGEKPGGDEKKKTAKEGLSDQRNPRTGYTPGEAEGIIRQYMDEITAPLTNRYHTPPPNKKDW